MKSIGCMCVSVLFLLLSLVGSPCAQEGELLWNAAIEYTWSSPVVVGSNAFMQDQEGNMMCYNTSDGSLVWQSNFAPDTYPTSSPVYYDGLLFAFAGTKLYKINPSDGSVIASFEAAGYISSQAPCVSSSTIYFSTSNTIYAVGTATLQQYWTKSVSQAANMVATSSVVYAFSDHIYCLDPGDGTEYWRETPPYGSGFNLGSVSGNFMAAFTKYDSNEGAVMLNLYTLSGNAGTAPSLAWSADLGSSYADNTPPAMDSTYVYAASRYGVLKAFELTGSGTAIWEKTVRDQGSAPAIPIVVDGKVYIQSGERDSEAMALVCLDGATGSQVWQTSMTGMQISWGSPVLVDNTLYLSTDHGGGLLAFDAGTVDGNWYMVKHNPALTGSDNGWAPDTDSDDGDDTCVDLLKMLSLDVSGSHIVNTPMTITANAVNECGGTIYYRFGIVPNYGTGYYVESSWTAISDYTTSNSLTYTFTEAGSYILTVTANSSPEEPDGAKPMFGGCITIIEE